ncbi:alpha/beta fold hydrolase [Rhodovarius crocodyli]|uniref:alpha/beta fold hydrolase n=1 Tax=Rhodovarius crocodyli TaxID=1979269 RepID=UPI0013E322B1|nr:alpha/beta fold hydrolase [Rhodovarius crocodyli]
MTAVSQTIDLPGGRIAWLESGEGPPLLLVHGIGGEAGAWTHQLGSLSAGRRVLAWDAPGYGGSAPLAGSGHVDRLLEWLDALKITRLDAVGHSLGAIFLALLARARPGLLRRVVLLHPMAGMGALPAEEREALRLARIEELRELGPDGFAALRGGAILGRAASDTARARAIAVMAAVPAAGYLAAWEALVAADIMPLLPALSGPALVISGEDDKGSPPELGRRIAAALPRAGFFLMPGVGHYAPIEAPAALDELLLAFLNEDTP